MIDTIYTDKIYANKYIHRYIQYHLNGARLCTYRRSMVYGVWLTHSHFPVRSSVSPIQKNTGIDLPVTKLCSGQTGRQTDIRAG